MFVDFNKVFKQEEPNWADIKLADNAPCKTCKYRINQYDLHPGYNGYPPLECANCMDRLNWIVACIQKLAWYEGKEI